jgi:hypothetical protein
MICAGPKGGDVIGPLIKGSIYVHHCFASRIVAHLVHGYEELPEVADRFASLTCSATCPSEDLLGLLGSHTTLQPSSSASALPSTPILPLSTPSLSHSSLSPDLELLTHSIPSTPATSTSPASAPLSGISVGSYISNVPRYHNRDRSASPQRSSAGVLSLGQPQSCGCSDHPGQLRPYSERRSVSASSGDILFRRQGAEPATPAGDIVMDLCPVVQHLHHHNQ